MYPSAELSSPAPVTVPGFELVAGMVSAVPGLSHAPLGARRNAGIIQLAVAVRLDGGTRSRRRQGMIGCREARCWRRSTQTGSRDVDLFFAEHSGVGGAADASYLSQLEDASRCSWPFRLDVDVCEGRSGNQAAWDVYWIRDSSSWKLRQGIQLGVRQMIGDRRLVVFEWGRLQWTVYQPLCVQITRLSSSHSNWNFPLRFPGPKKIRLHLDPLTSFCTCVLQ